MTSAGDRRGVVGRADRVKAALQRDSILVISGLFCIVLECVAFLVAVWEFLPDWVPVLGGRVVAPVPPWCCCFFCSSCALFGALIGTGLALLKRTFTRLIKGEFKNALVSLSILLIIIGFIVVVFIGPTYVNPVLLRYGISRYDRVIEAIERYKADNGAYPKDLSSLVPDYLKSEPGIFLKYGERLDYSPDVCCGDGAPFTFELYGHHWSGVHGQILKYCPTEFDCPDGDRINDKWMWTYSSPF